MRSGSPTRRIGLTSHTTSSARFFAVAAGRIHDVRAYCECDVLNTYLVFQRFRLMRGEVDAGEYARELSLVRERIGASDAPHWRAFIARWTGDAAATTT